MNADDQRAYYALREQQEIALANASLGSGAASSHREMAALYRKKVEDTKLSVKVA